MAQEQDRVFGVDRDWFLQKLVNMANYGGFEFGITLQIGGFLVSGVLVGGAKYFDGFAADFASGVDPKHHQITKQLKQGFAELGEFYKPDAVV
jgi:hypothetical protein